MSGATWVTGDRLTMNARRKALAWFVHRMTVENVRANPEYALRQMRGGYRCALLTDDEWLRLSRFAVTSSGALDSRVRRCEGAVGAAVTKEAFALQMDAALGRAS